MKARCYYCDRIPTLVCGQYVGKDAEGDVKFCGRQVCQSHSKNGKCLGHGVPDSPKPWEKRVGSRAR